MAETIVKTEPTPVPQGTELPATFINVFSVTFTADIARIVFGEQVGVEGTATYHSAFAIPSQGAVLRHSSF